MVSSCPANQNAGYCRRRAHQSNPPVDFDYLECKLKELTQCLENCKKDFTGTPSQGKALLVQEPCTPQTCNASCLHNYPTKTQFKRMFGWLMVGSMHSRVNRLLNKERELRELELMKKCKLLEQKELELMKKCELLDQKINELKYQRNKEIPDRIVNKLKLAQKKIDQAHQKLLGDGLNEKRIGNKDKLHGKLVKLLSQCKKVCYSSSGNLFNKNTTICCSCTMQQANKKKPRRSSMCSDPCCLMSLKNTPQSCLYGQPPPLCYPDLPTSHLCRLLGHSLLYLLAALILSPFLLFIYICFSCCCSNHCC